MKRNLMSVVIRRGQVLGASAAFGLMLAATAVAQQTPVVTGGLPTAPVPSKPDEPPTIMTLLVVMVIAAVVLFASLMPAKRGHQD